MIPAWQPAPELGLSLPWRGNRCMFLRPFEDILRDSVVRSSRGYVRTVAAEFDAFASARQRARGTARQQTAAEEGSADSGGTYLLARTSIRFLVVPGSIRYSPNPCACSAASALLAAAWCHDGTLEREAARQVARRRGGT